MRTLFAIVSLVRPCARHSAAGLSVWCSPMGLALLSLKATQALVFWARLNYPWD